MSSSGKKTSRNITAPHHHDHTNVSKKYENLLANNQAKKDCSNTSTYVDFRNFQFQPLEPITELQFKDYVGPTPESNWVVRNKLLVGAYPASVDDNETFFLISSILKLGITKFVCLQLEYPAEGVTEVMWRRGQSLRPYFNDVVTIVKEKEKYAEIFRGYNIVNLEGLSFTHYPIRDCGVSDDEGVLDLAKQLVKCISEGEVIYLHCWGGHGRTGTVVCLMLRLMYGMDAMEAMNWCQTVHDMREYPVDVGSPQTQQQRDQVIRIIRTLILKECAAALPQTNNNNLIKGSVEIRNFPKISINTLKPNGIVRATTLEVVQQQQTNNLPDNGSVTNKDIPADGGDIMNTTTGPGAAIQDGGDDNDDVAIPMDISDDCIPNQTESAFNTLENDNSLDIHGFSPFSFLNPGSSDTSKDCLDESSIIFNGVGDGQLTQPQSSSLPPTLTLLTSSTMAVASPAKNFNLLNILNSGRKENTPKPRTPVDGTTSSSSSSSSRQHQHQLQPPPRKQSLSQNQNPLTPQNSSPFPAVLQTYSNIASNNAGTSGATTGISKIKSYSLIPSNVNFNSIGIAACGSNSVVKNREIPEVVVQNDNFSKDYDMGGVGVRGTGEGKGAKLDLSAVRPPEACAPSNSGGVKSQRSNIRLSLKGVKNNSGPITSTGSQTNIVGGKL